MQGVITEEDATLPDLGPIPPPSPGLSRGSPDLDEDSAGEDEDDDEEEEDTKRRTRRRRAGTKNETKNEATGDQDDEGGKKEDARRKRGRPPRVDTPMECRIKNIMKGLRKCRDEQYDTIPSQLSIDFC